MPEREPEETRSPSPYPAWLSETRRALVAAEWVWRDKRAFPKDKQELFAAQFVLGKNWGDLPDVHAPDGTFSVGRDGLSAAPNEGSAAQSVPQREIVERDSPFQARLRGWLRSEQSHDLLRL
jgi:hypothetical protein